MQKISIAPAVVRLRELFERRSANPKVAEEYQQIAAAKDEVLARYQPVFAAKAISSLTEESFRDFLHFKNNRHWAALQRKGPQVCANMGRLRQALAILVDESRTVEDRLDQLVPARGPAFVPHLGKAILTPILLIHNPVKYGVWNNLSESAMRQLDVWPDPDTSLALGQRYNRVNEVVLRVAQGVGVDLWTLDSLWWRAIVDSGAGTESAIVDDAPVEDSDSGLTPGVEARFGLERHLHEFLRDNWEHTELCKLWKLYEEDGDSDAGYEYPTDVGRIDLLAKHRSEPRWLVIELKRHQTSDQTVGQVLRYMGWVKAKLAKGEETVEGMIVAHADDQAVRYALSAVANVELRLYEVQFRLKSAPKAL